MMYFFVALDDSEEFLQILAGLKDHGMNGIVMPSTSLKHALLQSDNDEVPIFGKLSNLVKSEFAMSHTLMMLIPDEKLEDAKNTVRGIVKDLRKKGVMFAMPVSFWEGLDY